MTDILSSNVLTLPSPQGMPVNEEDNRSEGDGNNHVIVESMEDSGSESERIAVKKKNNRTKRFSDSESDVDKENSVENIKSLPVSNASSDSDDYTSILKQRSKKSRIKHVKSDSDSDSEQSQLRENQHDISRESPHGTRISKKRNNFKKKFQDLLHSKNKKDQIPDKDTSIESEPKRDSGPGSSNDEEIASINEIKKKVKEHRNNLKMSVCDPDTSEDESSNPRHAQKPKKQQKRTKLISPKHQRMSAKQAMENMQKIKSESNRMLREKEVSLPYHRPKALSLKDIMSRRKPAVSSDGKVLPIKMNDEQLRQYALQLEQRQKEMMELCKSDTEEDEEEPNETAENTQETREMSVESTESATEINKESKTASVVPDNVHDSSSNNATNSENTNDPIIDTNTDIEDSVRRAETLCNDCESLQPDETVISNFNTDITNVEDSSENVSAEMELVYNDSVEGETLVDLKCLETNEITENNAQEDNEAVDCVNLEKPFISTDAKIDESVFKSVDNYNSENFTEKDSQLISLLYDTEKTDSGTNETLKNNTSSEKPIEVDVDDIDNNEFPDNDENDLDDINMEDIDKIIENAEIIRADMTHKKFNSPALVKDAVSLTSKPKLMGAPGMVIDLDGNDAALPKKLTGVELLKERFTYFAKLKTPEEMERDKEKRQKPGAQHLKLKHELEEKMADQRSLEWAKRLEGEKEHQKELEAIRGDTSDVEDDIDTIDAKLEEKECEIKASSSSEEEEEEIEDDVLIEDKPRKKNPLVEDEAEESDDETENDGIDDDAENDGNDDKAEFGEENTAESNKVNDESDDDSSNDEQSSESEVEQETKPKKGRILKAFEDSDDDETTPNNDKVNDQPLESNNQHATDSISNQIDKEENQESDKESDVTVPVDVDKLNEKEITKLCKSDSISESQDDDLQLAQVPKANSEDLFTSQESVVNKPTNDVKTTNAISDNNDVDLGSQTFSIMTSNSVLSKGLEMDIGSQEKISVISETQTFDDNLDAVVGMCSGTFSQNYIEFKPSMQSQNVESQAIGQDILDMCTGKFYDNEFVSQPDVTNTSTEITQECILENVKKKEDESEKVNKKNDEIEKRDKDILKSVLDELNEPEFESTKPMKFFFDTKSHNKDNEHSENNTQLKKKFVIDSDDDTNENAIISDKEKKKLKKKRLEKRALQISDDEDNEYSDQGCEDLMSENGDDQNNEEDRERLVEYDSEENEIEVKPQQKKKRKVADFFEQEAELSSEDEWAGSGDEDEAGLDRMEREEGDDEVFHQGKLQAELGQIHMRDVLDQDKREVRLIQELLFEDGDLGAGGRQRKFRWRNADGEEVDGPLPDELADTQEEEFESEEQWRKQRHEREMFLKQLKSHGEEKDDLNVSITRSTIIKANLLSRTMSSVLEEVNNKTVVETTELPTIPEKKITKDVPSPKKPFSVFQQNYHGSLLTRGRGALARLAALATPLAVDDDAPAVGLVPTSNRNFVFAAITPQDKAPKVTKRKAEATTVGTPRLVKKMRTEDRKQPKTSLLDHLKT